MITKAKSKYGDIWVSDRDHIGHHILEEGTFEEDLIQSVLPNIRDKSTVVDIGANIGLFSLAFSNIDCYVHSVEPQEFCINLMNNTFENIDNVKIYHNAMGDYEGRVHMNMRDDFGEFYNPNVCKNLGGMRIGFGGEEVNLITLDSMKLENISVIKIDVEGYEKRVFVGGKKTIERERPFITFESHHLSPPDLKFILDFLNRLNYQCEETEVMLIKNHICIPK